MRVSKWQWLGFEPSWLHYTHCPSRPCSPPAFQGEICSFKSRLFNQSNKNMGHLFLLPGTCKSRHFPSRTMKVKTTWFCGHPDWEKTWFQRCYWEPRKSFEIMNSLTQAETPSPPVSSSPLPGSVEKFLSTSEYQMYWWLKLSPTVHLQVYYQFCSIKPSSVTEKRGQELWEGLN